MYRTTVRRNGRALNRRFRRPLAVSRSSFHTVRVKRTVAETTGPVCFRSRYTDNSGVSIDIFFVPLYSRTFTKSPGCLRLYIFRVPRRIKERRIPFSKSYRLRAVFSVNVARLS